MKKENNKDILNNLFNKYSLDISDQNKIKKIILPIMNHEEFKRRMTSEFYHHGNITLGEHILEDTILTYKLSKKKKLNDNSIDIALKIAMFHDLYTIPWQNNTDAKVKHFFHKHGFRHPLEACINSINWYPEIFNNNDESKKIIDGILHHMFPLPVLSIKNKDINSLELKNMPLYNKLSNNYRNIINNALRRKKVGPVSLSRSIYQEGRIMAKADRMVSRSQIKDFSSFKSLITGHNKKINK